MKWKIWSTEQTQVIFMNKFINESKIWNNFCAKIGTSHIGWIVLTFSGSLVPWCWMLDRANGFQSNIFILISVLIRLSDIRFSAHFLHAASLNLKSNNKKKKEKKKNSFQNGDLNFQPVENGTAEWKIMQFN